MSQVCIYLQLHQPYRLTDFSILDIGQGHSYFASDQVDLNQTVFTKVSQKSYRPMLTLLVKLTQEIPDFKVALSCSGVFLEQAEAYDPEVVDLLKKLAKQPNVEFLGETYYHSLASLYSITEFTYQVKAHSQKLKKLFNVKPSTFRNTELIYVDSLAKKVADLGFKGMLTEGVKAYLKGKDTTQVFQSAGSEALPLLLKHSQLSDDIAFRFSNRDWQWFPLGVDQYLDWLEQPGQDALINLFMDFETFGEHQWEATGIFSFFETLIRRFITKPYNAFVLPKDALEIGTAKIHRPVYEVPRPISWADTDRDISAWTENQLQQDCLHKMYQLEKAILEQKDRQLLEDWRRLQTSDHFYYMCIKWSADGDVHAYFSPYDSPYEAYRRFSIVMADLHERLL